MKATPSTATQSSEKEIIVNGRTKSWMMPTINYENIIILAFGVYRDQGHFQYTITYSHGKDKAQGQITGGDIEVVSGMIFNATVTNNA